MVRVRAIVPECAVLSFVALSCSVPDRPVQVDRAGNAGFAGVAGSVTRPNSGGTAGASATRSTAPGTAGGSVATSNAGGAGTVQPTSLGGATAQMGGSTGLMSGGTGATAGATTGSSGLGGSTSPGASGGAAMGGGVAIGGSAIGGSATGGSATGGAATGGSAAWCATQTIPSGVVAADYQCVDFDSGLPPISTWPRTLTNSGTMQLTTARAASSPNSVVVTVPGADTPQTQATATATWNVVGADPISRVSLSASLSPPQIAGPMPDWTGYVSLLCTSFGYGKACLLYTRGADLIEAGVPYTGYLLSLMYSGGPAYINFCSVTGTPTPNIWTRVELRVTKGSPSTVQVFFNGTEAAKCTSGFNDDTVAKFTFGEEASSVMTAWTMHYDNVVAAVYR